MIFEEAFSLTRNHLNGIQPDSVFTECQCGENSSVVTLMKIVFRIHGKVHGYAILNCRICGTEYKVEF